MRWVGRVTRTRDRQGATGAMEPRENGFAESSEPSSTSASSASWCSSVTREMDADAVLENVTTQRMQVAMLARVGATEGEGTIGPRVPGSKIVRVDIDGMDADASTRDARVLERFARAGCDLSRKLVLVTVDGAVDASGSEAIVIEALGRAGVCAMVMKGGMRAWIDAGYPTTRDDDGTTPRSASTRLIVWAPPRSRSTAFERSLSRHSQAKVLHELLTEPFLKEKNPGNYQKIIDGQAEQDVDESCGSSYATALEVLTADFSQHGKPFFVSKELSCYFDDNQISDDWLLRFKHVVLVRDPLDALKSFYRVSVEGDEQSSYFDVSEAGFQECFAILHRLNRIGAECSAVDADIDLMKNPESTLRLVCDLVGVAFEPSMLEWEPKELKSWQKFRGWHEDASNSTGFQAIEKAPLQYPPEVFAGAKTCRPYYEAVLWSSSRALNHWPTLRLLSPMEHKFSIVLSASEEHVARDMHAKFLASRLPGASIYMFQPKWVKEAEELGLDFFGGGFVVCGTREKVMEMARALDGCRKYQSTKVVRGLIMRSSPEETNDKDDVTRLPFPCTPVVASVDFIDRIEFIDELSRTIECDLGV
jgi:hypothetical protein|tara:strand:- start:10466 stop:12238 length:1773 start_codon:yes stop_codon:yes gene_type:complete